MDDRVATNSKRYADWTRDKLTSTQAVMVAKAVGLLTIAAVLAACNRDYNGGGVWLDFDDPRLAGRPTP